MADTIEIACPECGKEFHVPVAAAGKKVRCKVCGEIIPVTGRPAADGAPAKKAGPAKSKSQGSRYGDDPDDDGKPYAVSTPELGPRCPECANEMGENDIICLTCGYNIRLRNRVGTKKIIDQTGFDYFVWLLPGILCALLVVVLIIANVVYLAKIGDWFPKDHSLHFLSWGFFRVWIVVPSLFAIFYAGRFAIKRLIFNPQPPEVELR